MQNLSLQKLSFTMQLSTVFSDFILSFVSIFVAIQIKNITSYSKAVGFLGFIAIGISAGLGAIHFLGIEILDPIYRFSVGFASFVGVPLIGTGFFHIGIKKLEKNFIYPIAGVFIFLYIIFGYIFLFPLLSTALGGVAMITVILVCIRKNSGETKIPALYGILGAILFILAGLVIGTTGSRGPILNVDIFHIVLAVAVYSLSVSLKRLSYRSL
ncbi:putative membrane protein [Leptospira weilii serovar Topaz str. LT2116]|uniref:Putative membrane protein n=2 Tax=Leptospira weilii TaxID=28184 RepID=M3G6W4_9LEPT|nr:putative membrane protein [Leptospira weilii serovar Topaz str. LT2116]